MSAVCLSFSNTHPQRLKSFLKNANGYFPWALGFPHFPVTSSVCKPPSRHRANPTILQSSDYPTEGSFYSSCRQGFLESHLTHNMHSINKQRLSCGELCQSLEPNSEQETKISPSWGVHGHERDKLRLKNTGKLLSVKVCVINDSWNSHTPFSFLLCLLYCV